MRINRVMIAAPSSGSGKTLIACALLQIIKKMGYRAAAYKCGPDYIDPMFHQKALGVPSKNLDTFFTGTEETRRLFLKNREDGDFAVLEGVMGLYDGLGGIREEGSSYHLARATGTPVILVADAKGMGRSLIAMLAGFLQYDSDHLIAGVILNRVKGGFFQTMRPIIERELGIAALGYLEEKKSLGIEGRRLGLRLPDEIGEIRGLLKTAAEEMERTTSVQDILRIARDAPELEEGGGPDEADAADSREASQIAAYIGKDASRPVIAVASDAAFCFYYEDNLELLEEYGAKLRFFSPLDDRRLPDGTAGLLLGGGYPELYAGRLGANAGMKQAILDAAKERMPLVAECGGFLYLHEALLDRDGRRYPMAGLLPGICRDTCRLVRFGYVELEDRCGYFLPEGGRVKGHEFHYFDSSDNGGGCTATKPATGETYPCVICGEHYWMGFPHLYYPSNPIFAQSFVKKAMKWSRRER